MGGDGAEEVEEWEGSKLGSRCCSLATLETRDGLYTQRNKNNKASMFSME